MGAISNHWPWMSFFSSLLPTKDICIYLDIYFRSEEIDNLNVYFNVRKIPCKEVFYFFFLLIEFNASYPLVGALGWQRGWRALGSPKGKEQRLFSLFYWDKSLSCLKFFLQIVSKTAKPREKKKIA